MEEQKYRNRRFRIEGPQVRELDINRLEQKDSIEKMKAKDEEMKMKK